MFQALVTFSLRQRVFVLAAAVILIGWGAILGRNMSIDLLPETRQPQVAIVTTATGYATQEVEQLISRPIDWRWVACQGSNGFVAITRLERRPSLSLSSGARTLTTIAKW